MERKVGTISRGIRCPIIRENDDLAKIVVDSVLEAAESEGFAIRDRDVIAMTESIVARAQGNYASIDAVATSSWVVANILLILISSIMSIKYLLSFMFSEILFSTKYC